MQNACRFAVIGALVGLGTLAVSVVAVPSLAEAKGFKRAGAAFAVGGAVGRSSRANAQSRNDETEEATPDEATEAKPVAADAQVAVRAPKPQPMVASAEPIQGLPVCIAGCYDKLGQPIKR